MDFVSQCIVFLMSGPNRESIDESELARIQSLHLDHLRKLHEDGYTLVAGPFGDQTDTAMRGLVVFRSDLPIDKVIELAEADPAVCAGRLRVEAVRWYYEKGSIDFPKSPLSTGDIAE